MAKKKMLKPAVFVAASVTYTCGLRTVTATPSFEVEGGCGGHDSGEYCYCSPTQVMARVGDCPVCGERHSLDVPMY